MEENFSMEWKEWNMERKIFSMEWGIRNGRKLPAWNMKKLSSFQFYTRPWSQLWQKNHFFTIIGQTNSLKLVQRTLHA